jgi:translation initiation factor IF-2
MNNQSSNNNHDNDNNQSGTRSKLTLKIKSSNVDNKQVANKNDESSNVRVRKTAVQVTIKGRKQTKPNENINAGDLNKKEFEARIKAVSKLKLTENESSKSSNNQSIEILKKISSSNKGNNTLDKSNIKKTSEESILPNISIDDIGDKAAESPSNEKVKSLNQVIKNSNDVEDASESNNVEYDNASHINKNDYIDSTNNNKSDDLMVASNIFDGNTQDTVNILKKKKSEFKIDIFDVRNKIKQSIEISNREKEEREKISQEKKLVEEKKIAEQKAINDKKIIEKSEKERKSKGKFIAQDITEEEDNKLKKSRFKEEKINTRKLTYFIDSESDGDDDFSSFRKRKKNRKIDISNNNSEYKKITREVTLPELITVADLAERMAEKVGDVVKKLFSMGTVATSNQVIDADTAEIIISEFGHNVKRVQLSDVENILDEADDHYEKLSRAPVVTIMGHVDHGKTSLLDSLRSTNVADGEFGGITQHIGASRVKINNDKYITFLDTPGHEAFTEMRSRGANATDIVVLVVAADDGVKEQTIEAINHAKAANVPIIVAVNKIDRPGADPNRVKNELLSHNIISEDLGGDVMFVNVSAKQRINLEKLEEVILLQAEMLELKSRYEGKASGVVLESKIDPNKGVATTLLVQKGVLNVGDLIVVGTAFGKVRKMLDDKGKVIKEATPSIAVEIMGLDNSPNAGDKFVEVDEEKQARDIIAYRLRKIREEKSMKNSARSFSDVFKESGKGGLKYLNIIIKGDVNGSIEAINSSILKLGTDEVAIKVIHLATGAITQSDISLAAVSKAVVIGFNVRANNDAKELAENKNIEIRYYSIIYDVVDDMKLLLSGMLNPVKNEQYLGVAEIRQIFKITGSGKIAGGFVTDGIIKRNAKVRLLRDNIIIHDGILKTLKRFKEDAKEVKQGFECGFSIENYDDIKEKDVIECYEINEQKRSL